MALCGAPGHRMRLPLNKTEPACPHLSLDACSHAEDVGIECPVDPSDIPVASEPLARGLRPAQRALLQPALAASAPCRAGAPATACSPALRLRGWEWAGNPLPTLATLAPLPQPV